MSFDDDVPVRFSRKGTEVVFQLPQREVDHIQRLIATHLRFYEEDVLRHAETYLEPGDLVVDAGAHIGNHTLFFATQCGARVVSFEPRAESFALLERNVGLNHLEERVTVHRLALGETAGEAVSGTLRPDNTGTNRLESRAGGDVRVVALDEIELPGVPRLIKVDVEGFEMALLRGARQLLQEHAPLLYVECQTLAEYDAVSALLAEVGYVARDILGATPTVFYQRVEEAGRVRQDDVQWVLHRLKHGKRPRVELPAGYTDALKGLQRQMDRLTALTMRAERRLASLEDAPVAKPSEARTPPPEASKPKKKTAPKASKKPAPTGPAWQRKLRKLQRDPERFLRDAKSPVLRDVVLPGVAAVKGFTDPDEEDGRGQRTRDDKYKRLARKLRLDPEGFFADAKSARLRAVGPVLTPLIENLPNPEPSATPSEEVVPDVASPTVRRIGRELPLPEVALVVVVRELSTLPLSALERLFEVLPDRAEVVLVTHAAPNDRLAATAAILRHRRTRLYLCYTARSTTDLLAYGVARASADRLVLVDGAELPDAEALSQAFEQAVGDDQRWRSAATYNIVHRAGGVVEPKHGKARGLWDQRCRAAFGIGSHAEDHEMGLGALTVLRLARQPVHCHPGRERPAIERLALEPEGRFDVYGPPSASVASRYAQHAYGPMPDVETFELGGALASFFVYFGPPSEGDLLDLGNSDHPVVCLEAHPAWYRSLVQQRSQRDKLTVIMTCFESAGTVEKALASVLAQTYRNLEVIVVDDHSRDDSFERLRRFAMHDPRVRVLRSSGNRGTYWCKNLGLTEATGDFVTFHDSDDVSPAHRFELQLAALQYEPQSIGNMVNYKRIGRDNRIVLFGGKRWVRAGRISLLLRRDWLTQRYGFFDSVRVGADDELIDRMRACGERIVTLPTCGYFARHDAGSLTTTGDTAITTVRGAVVASPVREAYFDAYTAFHEEVAKGEANPYLGFPLLRRPFAAPLKQSPRRGDDPNAAPRIVASMATMPRRLEVLKETVGRLLPQVDQLNIYLNEFDEVPEFLVHPKIRAVRSQEAAGDLKDNGKFYFASDVGENAYHVTVDDDLHYPADYVSHLVRAIERYDRRVVVGVHGVNLADPMTNYLRGRQVFHFKEALEQDRMVHLLGTGTVAYHSSTLEVGMEHFRTTGVADLWFGIRAKEAGIPMLTVRRRKNWLTAHDTGEDNLFQAARRDHEPATAVAEEHGPWKREELHEGQLRLVEALAAQSPATLRAEFRDLAEALTLSVRRRLPNQRIVVLVNGWNCADMVESCWHSVLDEQELGGFDMQAIFFDDGSSDGTWEILERLNRPERATLMRSDINRGPAWARKQMLEAVDDAEAICVLLDMDDLLTPHALRRISEHYAENPACVMSLGNWEGSAGRKNPLAPYSRAALVAHGHRRLRHFRCTPTRTFRRRLAQPLADGLFLGPDGEWLRYCTDVALMLPLLDRCDYEAIELVKDVLYIYTERRTSGTLARFGRPEKAAMHEWLARDKPVLMAAD